MYQYRKQVLDLRNQEEFKQDKEEDITPESMQSKMISQFNNIQIITLLLSYKIINLQRFN